MAIADYKYGPGAGIWQRISATAFRLANTVSNALVGTRIQANAAAADARLLEVLRTPVDTSTGTAQNGVGTVGLLLGTDGTAQNPCKFDGGTAVYESLGTLAKFIPTVISNPYCYINGTGSPTAIPRFVAVYIPHSAINGDAGASIGDNITLYTDGAPDVQPPVAVTGRDIGIWCGDSFVIGDSLYVGEDGNTGSFIEWKKGKDAVISAAATARQRYNEDKFGWEMSVAGEQYRPHPLALVYFETHDPASQSYPVGETVVRSFTTTVASAAYKGFRSIIPHRWTLPPQVAITGGNLVPGIRIIHNTGSGQHFQNATGSETQTGRDSVYLALANSYVVEIRFTVTNTSVAAASADLSYFQFEGTFI